MECLAKDLENCPAYLLFPKEHWKRIQSTNLVEHTIGKGRPQTKEISRSRTNMPVCGSFSLL